MAKMRIEVCPDEDSGLVRQEWMKQRGYTVDLSRDCASVMLDTRQMGGTQKKISDDDQAIWVVVGSK